MDNNLNNLNNNNNNSSEPIKKDFVANSGNNINSDNQVPKPPSMSEAQTQKPTESFTPPSQSGTQNQGTSGSEPFIPPQVDSSATSFSDESIKPKRSGLKLFLILLIVAILIAGAGLVYFLMLSDNDDNDVTIPPIQEEDIEEIEEEEEDVVITEPRVYTSLFENEEAFDFQELNINTLDRFSVFQQVENAINEDVSDNIVEFSVRHNGELIDVNDILSLVMPGVFGEEVQYFEEDFSFFAYYDDSNVWSGIVLSISEPAQQIVEEEVMNEEDEDVEEDIEESNNEEMDATEDEESVEEEPSLEERRNSINSSIENNVDLITNLFASNPGSSTGNWLSGSANGVSTRYIVFEEEGAAFNYGWLNDRTLLITTSYPSFLKALEGF